jgi:hypothetical protein
MNENDPEEQKKKSEVSSPKSVGKVKPERPGPQAVSKTGRSGQRGHKTGNGATDSPPGPVKTGIKEPQTENPPRPIEKMEVHHHPQLEHKAKPWKEYLLEGFMIFIAVMMGFIAENIREAIDNSEHVKQLTTQLVHDLKTDTAQLNKIYREEIKIANSNDSLVALLKQPLPKADTRRIQKQVADSHSLWLFHPSAGAIAAIKNELHLKQFSNSGIISYFATYEKDIELLHTSQDVSLQYQRLYLDPFLTQHFTPANMVAAFDEHAEPTARMRNLTQGDLDQLAADMVLIRIVTKEMLRDNRLVKKDAVDLLQYVTGQYQLNK